MIINVLINKWLIGVTGADVCLSVYTETCWMLQFSSRYFVTLLHVINNAESQGSVFQKLMCSFGFVFINQQVHAANTWLCVCFISTDNNLSTEGQIQLAAASGVLVPTSTILNH